MLFLKPGAKKVHIKFIANAYMDGNKALVSVVQGNDIYTMIKEGIDLLGGFDRIGVKGNSILIKPNIVNRYKSPANTNPLVIKCLIKLLRELGASKIFVGDMSSIYSSPTRKNAISSGIWDAIRDEDVEFVSFEEHGWVEVDIPHGRFVKKVIVSEFIYSVDKVINVPVIKTHKYAHYTISLKNFIGATHPQQRPYFIAPDFWDEIVTELNLAYTPNLNILDGTKIFVKGGPTRGTVATPNLIIATGDRIAADVVGLSVIKAFGGFEKANKDVWAQRQIRRAVELHLGISNPSEIHIVSQCLGTNKRSFDELMQKIHYNLNTKEEIKYGVTV